MWWGAGTARMRPTLAAIPPSASASRRGWGRSGSSRTIRGRAGSVGRPSAPGAGRKSRRSRVTARAGDAPPRPSAADPAGRSGGAFANSPVSARPGLRSLRNTCAVWPSRTGTRVVATPTSISEPRILLSSGPIFSSSPRIQGSTLPAISTAPWPTSPAPERAWSVTTVAASIPNARSIGASAIARPTTTQLGLATRAPPPVAHGWSATPPIASAFTSGTTRGVSGRSRWTDAFVHTTWPRSASGASVRAAAFDGSADRTSLLLSGAPGGRMVRRAASAGGSPPIAQATASP